MIYLFLGSSHNLTHQFIKLIRNQFILYTNSKKQVGTAKKSASNT
jgi:hypothetical protein